MQVTIEPSEDSAVDSAVSRIIAATRKPAGIAMTITRSARSAQLRICFDRLIALAP